MDIIISNASDKPIYEQITAQMKNLILNGTLAEGAQLPSMRALANDLRISVITTKRAYADLEAQGFIETVPGKGSFVAGGNMELLREERLRAHRGPDGARGGRGPQARRRLAGTSSTTCSTSSWRTDRGWRPQGCTPDRSTTEESDD